MKEEIFVTYWEGILGCDSGEALVQVAQKSFLSLEMLKARLDGAVSNWSAGRCPCPWQGGWTEISFKVPSNPKHSEDSGKFCSCHIWTVSTCEPVTNSCIVPSELQTVFCIRFKSSDYLHNQLDEPVLSEIQE